MSDSQSTHNFLRISRSARIAATGLTASVATVFGTLACGQGPTAPTLGRDAVPIENAANQNAPAPAIAVATATAKPMAAASGTATWWANLSQSQRGDLIFAAAKSYLGRVDTNCKEFARKVILQASKQLVTIPSTTGDYKWVMPNAYVYPVPNLGSAVHGDVIQMRLYNSKTKRWGPHTAILVSISGDTMTVIDSNFVTNGSRLGIVAQHSWSISTYLKNPSKVSSWTLYRIGRGR